MGFWFCVNHSLLWGVGCCATTDGCWCLDVNVCCWVCDNETLPGSVQGIGLATQSTPFEFWPFVRELSVLHTPSTGRSFPEPLGPLKEFSAFGKSSLPES